MKINFKLFNIIQFVLLFIVTSCATSSNQTSKESVQNNLKPDIGISEPKKEIKKGSTEKDLNAHFESLVQGAIKKGQESMTFLATDLFIKAMDSSLNGDPYSAAFLLKYSLKLMPDEIYMLKKYGIELIKTGKIKEALVIAKKVVKKTSYEDESYSLILAGIYTALGKTKQARLAYHKMMKAHPKSVEACTFLGKSYIETKEYKLAKKHLRVCNRRIKNTGIFNLYLGKVSMAMKDNKKAIYFFKKALKISPKMEDAILALGEYFETKEMKKYDLEALSHYKKFLKTNPENFNILTRLVDLMFKNEDYKSVISYAETLAQLDPSDLNLKVRLGIVYTDFKMYELAKDMFKDILITLPKSDKVIYYLASLYQQTGEMHKSVEYFSKIENSSNLYKDSSLQIAQILRFMAQSDKAGYSKKFISFTNKMLKEIPELNLEFTIFLVGHYDEIGETHKAISSMEAISNSKKFTDDHSYLLASLLEKVKEFNKSEAIVNQILERNPEDPNAMNFLGYSFLERGVNLERAFYLLTSALKLRPEDGYIHDSLGWYYFKVGHFTKAKIQLEKAYKFVKTDSVISHHLAKVYSKLKQYKKAQKYLKIALELSPSPSEALAIAQEIDALEKTRLPASKK